MMANSRRVELVEAAVIVVVSAVLFAMTTRFSEPLPGVDAPLTSASFPRIVLAGILLLGIAKGVLALRVPIGKTTEIEWDRYVLPTALLGLAYGIASRYLGVFLPMPVFIFALSWLWGGRDIVKIAAISLGMPLCIWLFFTILFQAQLPLLPSSAYD